ncbi:MAG: SH3 domain-containing protein [Alphaproteobacteria bacterium]|nr:SH3 domain-containing protein [Alphaproteobacteria bacterium]
MRKLSNPTSRRKARQIQAGKASPNPVRFATLTLVIIASVAAGTTLGATMIRFDLGAPKQAAVKEQPAVPSTPQPTSGTATKTVVAVKTRAVNPLQPGSGRTRVNALPASSDRFGNATQQAAAHGDPLADRLRARKIVDGGRTGSIKIQATQVEIAESEDEIIALERKLSDEGAAHFNVPDESTRANGAPAPSQKELRKRQTAKYVNLRAGPDNDADVLTIVPAKTVVLAEDNCVHWCAAVYQGQQGFIYKSFFRGAQPPAEE